VMWNPIEWTWVSPPQGGGAEGIKLLK